VAWVVAVLLTLLLARRRVGAIARLAIGSLLALGLLALGLVYARNALIEDLTQRDVAQAVWDVVVTTLWHEIDLAALLLVIVMIVTAVLALGSRGGRPSGAALSRDAV
jgi:hypothetical protein